MSDIFHWMHWGQFLRWWLQKAIVINHVGVSGFAALVRRLSGMLDEISTASRFVLAAFLGFFFFVADLFLLF